VGKAIWGRLACAATALGLSGFGLSGCGDSGSGDPCLGTGGGAGTLEPDSLEDFSAKCLAAIGLDVPGFNCDEGTLVPTNNASGTYPDQTCDAPNVLEGDCDPGSRFQVLAQTDEAIVVAHCRKQDLDDGFYGDIAVIQYNQVNGATCFYQALGNLPAEVTAPSQGIGPDFPWQTPATTASQDCVACHDNGPLIRSPYLAQLRDVPVNPLTGFTDRLPGTNDDDEVWGPRFAWNKTQPYTFVGNDFQGWKVEYLSVADVSCTSCHRMGVSRINGVYDNTRGTSLNFGPISTAMDQVHKNPHSEDSIWMTPDQIIYVASVEAEALAVQACAEAIVGEGVLPAGCSAVPYGAGDTCEPATTAQAASESPPAPTLRERLDRVNPVGVNP